MADQIARVENIMMKKFSIVASLAMAMVAAPAFATLRIDFSDDEGNQAPGFRISNVGGGPTSDRLDLGSGVPGAADGVDFLRVSSTEPVSGDILGFIIRVPAFRIGLVGGEVYGDGLDIYSLSLFNPADSGFAVYHAADVGLTTPLVTGDFNVSPDALIIIGAAGLVFADVNFGDISNLARLNNGPYPTLDAFVAQGINGADFAANIGSAGADISAAIQAGATVEGSANGNVFVPEPGTLALLVAGALFARVRRASR